MKLNWNVVAIGARVFLGLIFFTSGMSKLIPFPGVIGPVWLEDALMPHGLGAYARFIAWSEAFIGLLLLSRRFATVGAIMLVPLLANILAVVTSLDWRGTPYVVGFLLLLNIGILVHESRLLRSLISDSEGFRRQPLGPWQADVLGATGIGLCLLGVPLYEVSGPVAYTVIALGVVGLAASPIWRRRWVGAAK